MRTFGFFSLLAAAASLTAPAPGVFAEYAVTDASCSTTGVTGTAAAGDPYWLQSIKHQGLAAFNANPSGYQVFRNVKDFGARGDGVTDDTAAINKAITSGTRCGQGCDSTTTQPAVVYFPAGTYKVSTPLIAYYYTVLIGDARKPPKLLAAPGFSGLAVIDVDPYIPGGGGAQWYLNQNNFFRSVRNFVIDLTQTPATATTTGIHWQVSQATSIMNVVFEMSTAANTAHQGIWMENGSGGFMGDMIFNGGKYAMWVGNQQFTVRNVTMNNCNTAIYSIWNWGWTFQGVTVNKCQVAFDLATGGVTTDTQTTGSIAVIDAHVSNTPILVRSSTASGGSLHGALVLNNIHLTNVPTAVAVSGGATILAGSTGTMTIKTWGQGNVYTGTSKTGKFTQGSIAAPSKPASLLSYTGYIFGKSHPQYANFAASQVVSVRDQGAKGDGKTDDTAALQAVFDKFAGCKLIFVDHGTYVITNTLRIPPGAQVVGEAWSVFLGSGSAFANKASPKVVVQVGKPGDTGNVEISDIIFATRAPAAGAIVVEWNIHSNTRAGAGMWDSHIRLGGADGTNLLTSNCANGTVNAACSAAYLGLHLTAKSTAYLEGTWVWLADHDLDSGGSKQITAFSGRGILSESAGPVWMIGTGSEHHALYQYNLVGAKDHYMGLIQTETPYYQPDPAPPSPFAANSTLHDPKHSSGNAAWAVNIESSTDIIIFGAGTYSFYTNYKQTCLTSTNCQNQLFNINSDSSVSLYSLATVGSTNMLSIDGQPVVPASANVNGFQSSLTAWSKA
ncbi:exo-beta-1,3-glucanase [Ganoderma leucocontextum]|nr:exo-beta-1,3-glucanase [Ganoderma leucocontextum]